MGDKITDAIDRLLERQGLMLRGLGRTSPARPALGVTGITGDKVPPLRDPEIAPATAPALDQDFVGPPAPEDLDSVLESIRSKGDTGTGFKAGRRKLPDPPPDDGPGFWDAFKPDPEKLKMVQKHGLGASLRMPEFGQKAAADAIANFAIDPEKLKMVQRSGLGAQVRSGPAPEDFVWQGPPSPTKENLDLNVQEPSVDEPVEAPPEDTPPEITEEPIDIDQLYPVEDPVEDPIEAEKPLGGPDYFDTTPEQEELKRQEKINRLEAMRGLGEGLDLMGRGLAGMAGNVAPEDFGKLDMLGMEKDIAQAEDTIRPGERRLLADAGYDIGTGDMSFERIRSLLPVLEAQRRTRQNDALMQDRLRGTQERFDANMAQKKKDRLSMIGGQFQSQPGVKDTRDQNLAVQKGLEALQEGTSVGDRAAVINAARASGEKGPLSDTDLANWLTRMGYAEQFADWISTKFMSRLSEAQRAAIGGLLGKYRDVNSQAIRDRARAWADRNAKIYGIDPEDLYQSLLLPEESGGAASAAPAQSDTVDMVLPDGNVVPGIHRTQVERFQQRYPGASPRG